ncbi:protein SpAN [Trichonephila inaurata madagascariensis]|uniref:Metalloendopeptidase n=1 Tax=Trichonephila inaurata madagascariensis TaxID=2747483 RepID=A0A8X6X074_9ARAC|nr:protein SpAN [Trichonephila inaurata madagascariensis]
MIAQFLLTLIVLNVYNFSTIKTEGKSNGSIVENEFFPVKGFQILSELNPTKTDDGRQIVEGDIALPWGIRRKGSKFQDENENKEQEMKGIINILTLWTNGKVSYNFHSSVDDELKTMIIGAMGEWENHTCLTFHEKALDYTFIRFRADKDGCWSMIGRINSIFAGQDVSIGRGCNRTNIIVHEIGHAIGLYHEQSRNDRDGYIHINWHNMPVARYSQFDRGIESPRGVEYDYTSVMHYGPMAFTEKYFQKNTIAAMNPFYQTLIGSGLKISFRDSKLVNKMYSCNVKCPNNVSQCLNGGFLSPYRNDDQPCHCICPPGATGEFCENLSDPFEYYQMPPCGGNVTEDTEIQTPGYPNRKPPSDSCIWWMQAPKGKRVRVEFVDFSFHSRLDRNDSLFHRRCYHERVEIRTKNRYDGDMFCGEDIPPGTMATSKGREFIIIIDTNENAQEGRGLKAKVSIVDENAVKFSDKTLVSLLPIQ